MGTSGRTDTEYSPAVAQLTNSLEQVRELLFGQHYREIERKLGRIDAHLASESDELRKDIRRRLEVLQTHVYKEVEALTARIEDERGGQLDAVNKIAREAREAAGALDQRVTKVEEVVARAQRELRQQILDQAKQSLDEIQQMRAELTAMVEREFGSLRGALEGGGYEPVGSGAQPMTAPEDHH